MLSAYSVLCRSLCNVFARLTGEFEGREQAQKEPIRSFVPVLSELIGSLWKARFRSFSELCSI